MAHRRRAGIVTAVEVLLVRHGQSVWNAEGRWQGTLDPPLSELGGRQARAAGRSLSTASVDAVWASPLDRAHHTARLIALAIGYTAVWLHDGLRERFAGEFQGLTRAEIDSRWPGWLEQRRHPSGWEDDDALVARAVEAIAAGAEHARIGGHRRAVAVTHGGVLMALDRSMGIEPTRYPNLSGRWVTVLGGEVVAGDRIELVPEGIDLGVE